MFSPEHGSERRSKKVGSRLRWVTQKRYKGHLSVTAFKKTDQIIKFVIVTVGPLFFNSKSGNRTKESEVTIKKCITFDQN